MNRLRNRPRPVLFLSGQTYALAEEGRAYEIKILERSVSSYSHAMPCHCVRCASGFVRTVYGARARRRDRSEADPGSCLIREFCRGFSRKFSGREACGGEKASRVIGCCGVLRCCLFFGAADVFRKYRHAAPAWDDLHVCCRTVRGYSERHSEKGQPPPQALNRR